MFKVIKYNLEKIVYAIWNYALHFLLNLKYEFGFFMICHEIRAEWVKTEITDPNQQFG